MIQAFREKMKSAIVVSIVVLFFIVPMVLTGVGGNVLGSVAGGNAATVGDTVITNLELRRSVETQRQRYLSQEGVDPSAEFLKPENLREPVLTQLTRRAALIDTLKKAGMAISDEMANKEILSQEQFHIEGKFNAQAYRRILANVGYTPATYKAALSTDLLLQQYSQAINASAFTTEPEVAQLVGLVQQKRTFDIVTVPQASVAAEISVADEEINNFYEANKSRYMDPEQVSVNYIELSVDTFAEEIEVSDVEIEQEFNKELEAYAASTEYQISHILIDPTKEGYETKVSEVTAKLAAGESFEDLVKEYSDDKFTLPLNGHLGVLDPEAYSTEFNEAVYALEVGQVSDVVTSDIGKHFVKLDSKNETTPPTLEDRKLAIESSIKMARAEEMYVTQLEALKELVYSATNLSEPAQQLGLKVKNTSLFTRTAGTGIAQNANVRNAAFKVEVLEDGYNSEVIELSNQQAVVLRKKEHNPAKAKSLESVSESIKVNLVRTKTNDMLINKAEEIIEGLEEGGKTIADYADGTITTKRYERVKASSADLDPALAAKVFEMELPEDVNYDYMITRAGDVLVIQLSVVELGTINDLPEAQRGRFKTQIAIQKSQSETSNFENAVFANTAVKIH